MNPSQYKWIAKFRALRNTALFEDTYKSKVVVDHTDLCLLLKFSILSLRNFNGKVCKQRHFTRSGSRPHVGMHANASSERRTARKSNQEACLGRCTRACGELNSDHTNHVMRHINLAISKIIITRDHRKASRPCKVRMRVLHLTLYSDCAWQHMLAKQPEILDHLRYPARDTNLF